ncbi:MAG: vancomycin resistance histidine kinase VanS [Anaerovoracaceae bacterium]
MRIKRNKTTDEYRQLKTKIFTRTLIIVAISLVSVMLIYSIFLQGHFANFVVGSLETLFGLEYYSAINIYDRIFRQNMMIFFAVAIILVFFIILRFYLNLFTKYFKEVNESIDVLVKEKNDDVKLSPELSAIEKKINTVKHTLEKRTLEAQIAEQRKNDLVVYLAHDLKTPLTSVIGYLTLLRDENEISEELRQKYLSISLDKAQRLEDLINEFFEITRFNLTNISLQCSTVNLTRMIQQLLFEFRPMFEEKSLSCNLSADADIYIKCDVDKMQRVFDNLTRNMLFYSFPESTAEVKLIQEDDKTKIIFTNKGDTIPPEKLDRIFEQFYRLDSARSSNSGGAGLGLAISKEIVELHNGQITAKSEKEKTEFTISIPSQPLL